eukprot:16355532-Heterocapsa_arctica.AAC.1
MNDEALLHEVPLFIDTLSLPPYTGADLHRGKVEDDETVYFRGHKHIFHPDAMDKGRKVIKEFYGCLWHGC